MDVSGIKSAFSFGGRRLRDVVGFDFGASGVRAVRLATGREGVVVSGVWSAEAPLTDPLVFPHEMRARAAAIAVSHPDAVARLLFIPRPASKLDDVPFADLLGIADPQAFRMAMEIAHSHASETHVLLAAIPETDAAAALHPFAQGIPAPQSLEVAGLAAINGLILCTPAIEEQSAILLDLGAEVATVAITTPRRLAFVRQFRIGANTIMKKLGERLGMDAETAREAVGGGVVDATEQIRAVFDPLTNQIILGRDFVSRRFNVRPDHVYVSGGLFRSPAWAQPLQVALDVGVTIWNPLADLPAASGALDAETVAEGCRFAAAVGAALGILENTPA